MKKRIMLFVRGHGKHFNLILKMKLLIFFVVLLNFQISASVYSQEAKVSITLKNATLKEMLNTLKQQSGYSFVYSDADIKEVTSVNLNLKNVSIEEVLNEGLKGLNLTYEILNDVIILRPVTEEEIISNIENEEFEVKGKVTDSEGLPLPGTTVLIKGTVTGVTTNDKGEYTIKVNSSNAVLQFSFIGFETQEIQVGSKKEINVIMVESAESLQEVVITGYQEINKERMTGSTNTISVVEMRNKGHVSVDEILDGTIPGLTTIASGRPGEDAQITIRGVNSLTGSTAPMWIVDGMPMQGEIPNISDGAGDLQTTIFTTGIGNITPDDIETITILKDAAATAIYGARAANGVIVITTKSGHKGKTFFNFTTNFTVTDKPSNNIRMMNSAEKVKFEKELYQDIGRFNGYGRIYDMMGELDYGKITQTEFDTEYARLAKVNTDWFDEIFRKGFRQQSTLSMQGGTEKTQYYASLSYNNERGIEPNNKYEKVGLNVKLTHNPSENVRITLGLISTMRKDRRTASRVNPLQYAMYANPYEFPFNTDGSYAYDYSWDPKRSDGIRDGLAWDKFNIIHDLNNNTNKSRYIDASANLKFEWEIIKGLMFTSQSSYNVNSNHNFKVEGVNTYTNFKNNWLNNIIGEISHERVLGSLRESTGYSSSFTFRNTITYNKEINDTHFINFFAGQEITRRDSRNAFTYSPQYDEIHGVVGFPQLDGVDPNVINFRALGGTGESTDKLSSFFANGSYSYMDKYIVSGAIRYDGSDIVGNENQFTPLWNISGRWNLHKEDFMQNFSFLNELSLRAGYGFTGSIDKKANPYLVMYINQVNYYDGDIVPSSFTYPSPSVKWQTKKDFNIGLDLALFKNRVEFSVNYYHNTTKDVLDTRRLPYSSGRGTVIENVANILNTGWEFSLSTRNIETRDFKWITRFNISLNDNKVLTTYYKSLDDLPISATGQGYYVEGYPVNAWYGYQFAGIDQGTGETLIYDADGNKFNIDDVYSNSNLNLVAPSPSYLGEAYPPISGGITSTWIYKRWTFTAMADFKAGHMIESFNTNKRMDSKNRYITDQYRWRQPGDITDIPAYFGFSSYAYGKYTYNTTIEKGDYLRLTYITLGYNFSPEFIKSLGFKTMRLSATVRNLFTLSSYSGIDPVLMGRFGYPNTKNYTVTLNVGF